MKKDGKKNDSSDNTYRGETFLYLDEYYLDIHNDLLYASYGQELDEYEEDDETDWPGRIP